jgi:hypothetical protein
LACRNETVAAVSFRTEGDIGHEGGDEPSRKAYEDMAEIEKMLEGTTRGDPLAMDPGKKLGNLSSCHPGIRMLHRCFAFALRLPIEFIDRDGP